MAATVAERAAPLGQPGEPYAEELLVAVELALACGEAMRQCLESKGGGVSWKDAGGIDPVTETDEANERRVVETLKDRFPSHLVIGEEAAAQAGCIPQLTGAPTWVVDPIDGTTNFVHGLRLSCVSIGLCCGGEPVLGVVYEPYADELFAAVRGQGAFLNGRRLAADGARRLGEAMVLFELGYERSEEGVALILGALQKLLLAGVRATRHVGSAVLSIAWVACGRASAYYTGVSKEGGKPWDYAAAVVIAAEAGAHVCSLDGGRFTIEGKSCLCAASEDLATELAAVVGSS